MVKARAARRSRLRAGAAAALVTAVMGCAESPAETPAAAPPTTGSAASPAAFCESVVTLDMAAGSSPADLASVTAVELPSVVDAYSNTLRTLLPAVQANAPSQLLPAVATLVRLNLDAAARGDATVYRRPEFLAADRDIAAYVLANCGFRELKVRAREYAYEGLPADKVVAATVAITLTDAGAATHALLVERIAAGETRPVSALVGLSPDQQATLLDPVGAVRVDPGQTATVFLRLTPGRYAVLCPVPTPPAPPPPAPTTRPGSTKTPPPPPPGPPHFTKGEFGELTVEA